jgi:kynureninase
VRLDEQDPLAEFRTRFLIPDDGLVYLDGNSLGRLPASTPDRVAQVLTAEWGERLIRSWEERWLALPASVGDRLGTGLLGARPGETVVCDTTTANLFKLLHAAYDLVSGRGTVLADRADFPTDRYVAAEVARQRGGAVSWLGPLTPGATRPGGLGAGDVVAHLHEDVAVLLLSVVDYRTAAIADVAGITSAVHAAGAVVLWDCSHAVGALPLDLPGAGADLAVGCSYKFLDGGPGAPAWLWVNQALHPRLGVPPIPGWLGGADPFAMGPQYQPAPGVLRFVTGTTNPVALACVAEGLELVLSAGVPAIRRKSEQLTTYAIDLVDAWLAPLGVRLGTPRAPDRRGSHVSVHHPEAGALCRQLAEHGIVADLRPPDLIRLGLSPLSTRFTDVHDAVAALRALLAPGPPGPG